jgi:hypothetical protein
MHDNPVRNITADNRRGWLNETHDFLGVNIQERVFTCLSPWPASNYIKIITVFLFSLLYIKLKKMLQIHIDACNYVHLAV